MYITLSDINGTNLFIVPIVPPDVDFKDGGENDTTKTVKGNIRLIGKKGLKTVAWSSIFPVFKNYGWVKGQRLGLCQFFKRRGGRRNPDSYCYNIVKQKTDL